MTAVRPSIPMRQDPATAVLGRLLAMLKDGVPPSDGRLPTERELSETMGVRRRALRRALESLEAEGLVWRKQGKGTFADQIELWDGALHRMIARTAGNAPLLAAFSILDEIRGNASWRALRSQARSIAMLRVSDREHEAIIDAIESGQPDRAETAMRNHLTTLAENLRRILGRGAGKGE